ILTVAVDSSSVERPIVSWTLDFGGSLAGAKGGLGATPYSASPSSPDPRCEGCEPVAWNGSWSFVMPSSASSVQLPVLPDELACFRPTSDSEPQSLAFVKIET